MEIPKLPYFQIVTLFALVTFVVYKRNERRVQKLYLVQRGEVWHYHRRVPTALVSVVGKKFFKKSLGVKDLKSALPLRNVYNIHVDAQLAAAEKILSGAKIKTDPITQDTAPVAQTSIEELTENVRQYVEGLDLRKSVHFLSKPPDDEDQRRAMKEDAEIGLQTLRNRDNPNGADWIKRSSQKFLELFLVFRPVCGLVKMDQGFI